MVALSLLLGACVTERPSMSSKKKEQLVATLTELGAGYMQRGKFDVAHHELRHALNIDPDNSRANDVMGLLYARLGDYDKAEHYLRKAISAQSRNSDAQTDYALFLCQRGRLKDADRHFRAALKNPLYKSPQLADTYAGLCALKVPDNLRAEKYFRSALVIDPALPVPLYYMARISFSQGQLLPARDYIHRYFKVAKPSPRPLLLAVRIERALGDRDAAASYAVSLRGMFPDSPQAQQLRALEGR